MEGYAGYALTMLLACTLMELAGKIASLLASLTLLAWSSVEAATACATALIVCAQALPIAISAMYALQLWGRRLRAKAAEEVISELTG